jgi:hypothetical protein
MQLLLLPTAEMAVSITVGMAAAMCRQAFGVSPSCLKAAMLLCSS